MAGLRRTPQETQTLLLSGGHHAQMEVGLSCQVCISMGDSRWAQPSGGTARPSRWSPVDVKSVFTLPLSCFLSRVESEWEMLRKQSSGIAASLRVEGKSM